MQSFKGSLANFSLSLVVPALFEAEPACGTLVLEQGPLRRHFTFRNGCLISAASSSPREHLAQILADLDILDALGAARAYEAAENAGKPFGAFLIEQGWVERSRLLEALAHKARESFFDCYQWEVGTLEFAPELPPMRDDTLTLELKLDALHRDARARLAEWQAFKEIFPAGDTHFSVYREAAADWATDTDETLVALAERGASLSEILASSREGRVLTSRRVLRLYRGGVICPSQPLGPKVGESIDIDMLVGLARQFMQAGAYDSAATIATQVLESGAAPEAHELFRRAEQLHAEALRSDILRLEGRLHFKPLPRRAPPELTADDFYVFSKLQSSSTVETALRSLPMGEPAAYRSVLKLLASGLIHVTDGEEQRAKLAAMPRA